MESVGDDAKTVFHEDQKFKSVPFEIFGKCSESVGFVALNKVTLLKITKVLYLQMFIASSVLRLLTIDVPTNYFI